MSILLFIFYFLLLKYTSYLFFPLEDIESLTIVLILVIINCLSVYFELKKSNIISRSLMFFSESLKFIAIIYAFLSLAIIIVNSFIFQIPTEYARLSLIIVAIIYLYSLYHARDIKIIEREIPLENLSKEITILHISDIHVGSIIGESLMTKIVKNINKINPDLVIISGDLADGTCAITPNHFNVFKKSNSQILFTPGNHDYYPDIEHVKNAASNAGMIILDNESMKFDDLNIYGIAYSFYDDLKFDNEINKNENNLLIFHAPLYWDEFRNMGFNIQLSGHSHGGQFYPAKFLVKRMFHYNRGLFEKDGAYLNVSDGIGTFGPPLRWGTNCEMSLLKLKRKNKD